MEEIKQKMIREFEMRNYPIGSMVKDKLMESSLNTIQGKLRSMELMPSVIKFGGYWYGKYWRSNFSETKL